jgi:hypothetical protein
MKETIKSIEKLLIDIENLDFEDLNIEEKKYMCLELNRQFNFVKSRFEKEQHIINCHLGFCDFSSNLICEALEFKRILKYFSYARRAKGKFTFPNRDCGCGKRKDKKGWF